MYFSFLFFFDICSSIVRDEMRGLCWFVVESKLFEISMEEEGQKLKGVILGVAKIVPHRFGFGKKAWDPSFRWWRNVVRGNV